MRPMKRLVKMFVEQTIKGDAPLTGERLQEALEAWAQDIVHTTRMACAARARHGFQQIEVEQIAREQLEDTAQYIEDGDLHEEIDAASAAKHRVMMTVRYLVEDYQVLQGVAHARTE